MLVEGSVTCRPTCYDCAKPKAEVEGLDTPSYTDYASAEDFFEAVREASREAERTRLTLLQMEAREGVRAQRTACGYASRGHEPPFKGLYGVAWVLVAMGTRTAHIGPLQPRTWPE